MVVHTCKFQLLGRQKWGRLWFEASLSKKFTKPHLKKQQRKKPGMVAQACDPSYAE
jgi:hypothetical protein